ncbi:pyridoxal-phosphate dependent enzyme [Kitasatospora phosalacinea]|uniref:pyridoxal-phosphate dependent enzyme n=1 Tax=Kitasatospora phosalacinea TaxID=2065 RepID=UPI0036484D3F
MKRADARSTRLFPGAAEEIPSPDAAAEALRGHVLRTPMRRLHWLEQIVGVPVWAKLELQQHTGSFKYRGAYLAVSRLDPRIPVVAASAGNHGLAVAEVARRLGRVSNIVIPANASRLKREHIIDTGAGLIEYGSSLEEATGHAQALAAAEGHYFLSPYNDPAVIAGNSTIALEVLDEVTAPTFVVPMGGGGLVSGIALGAAARGGGAVVFGCEPDRYPSVSRSSRSGRAVRVVPQPTIADGLAVNLDPGSLTIGLVREHVRDTVLLSEEELAAATYSLLVRESLLVEPAGAASVVACLRLAEAGRLDGPVVLPLCGGNLHHTTLAQIQQYPYRDDGLMRLLDLVGRRVQDTRVSRQRVPDGAFRPGPAADPEAGSAQELMTGQLDACVADLADCLRELSDFDDYRSGRGLVVPDDVIRALRSQITSASEQLTAVLDAADPRGGVCSAEQMSSLEAELRWGMNTVAHVRGSLEWCSAAYDQSRSAQFFGIGAQDNPTVNYERYEGNRVRQIENQLLQVLGLAADTFAATLTSSGMAAYSLIESYLIRDRLTAGSTVLTAPYIYFEAAEQLLSLPHLRCVRAADYSTRALLDAAREHRPALILLDPVANTPDQRMADVGAFLAALRTMDLGHQVTVVVDGTVVSGAVPGDWLVSDDRVQVIYYESCSKYLQLGLDATMAGVVVHPVALRARLERLRRNTGTILYRHSTNLFPQYDRDAFLKRMRRISANALAVAEHLSADSVVSRTVRVAYPGHPSHPDHEISRSIGHAGGCVTFQFAAEGDNNRSQLEAFIDDVLHRAREADLYLTKGVSFGFSTPRISAASSMAENEPPFLRLYVGDRGEYATGLLAKVMAEAFARRGSRGQEGP